MRVVVFLPVKGTSERIENKNMALLDGKPLFLHTLEKIANCPFIDEVYLDTESDAIYDIAKYIHCTYLKRNPKLSTNKTDGHSLFYNEAIKVEADIYVQILGTSPFIKPETIKKGIEILQNSPEYDSVVLVKAEKKYCWDSDTQEPLYDREHIPNSKDLPDTLVETMGLYITNKEVALTQKRRYGKKPYLLSCDALEAVDINYPEDFILAELIVKGIRLKEINYLNFLKRHVNSPMLSDVMDDLGVKGAMNGFCCNLNNKKIWGRAKTLKIRELQEGEDFNGIYDALKSYSQVTNNDIILVENECPELAYFGELNAMLSIQSGAAGTIVGGATRDHDNVAALCYPVFAKGYNCKDVRKRATLESINQTIELNGVSISPNDLVFADHDGIVIIPARYEKEIMKAVEDKISMEGAVAFEIKQYADPMDIVAKIGAF